MRYLFPDIALGVNDIDIDDYIDITVDCIDDIDIGDKDIDYINDLDDINDGDRYYIKMI